MPIFLEGCRGTCSALWRKVGSQCYWTKLKDLASSNDKPSFPPPPSELEHLHTSGVLGLRQISQERFLYLDGPTIRKANRGDSLREKNNCIALERFARIASNLQFAIFSVPKRDSPKRVHFGNPEIIREPSKYLSKTFCNLISDRNPWYVGPDLFERI